MKTFSLRPYPGTIHLFPSREAYQKGHKARRGAYDIDLTCNTGRFTGYPDERGWPTYLIWGDQPHDVAHEFGHVILETFQRVGIDPREANGEPFCYLLSQLLYEASL